MKSDLLDTAGFTYTSIHVTNFAVVSVVSPLCDGDYLSTLSLLRRSTFVKGLITGLKVFTFLTPLLMRPIPWSSNRLFSDSFFYLVTVA